jgi:hypothetical protein
MHLIVVRRDLVGFQHLHATMRANGNWTTKITRATAGVWRAFAAAQFDPIDLPTPDSTASTDGTRRPSTQPGWSLVNRASWPSRSLATGSR